MPTRSVADRVRGATVAAFATLAIVATTHAAVAAPRTPMYARPPKILTNVLYVSDSKLNVIDVFEADFGKRFPMYGQLSMPSRPEGITTDSADNLYVTVRGSVLVYPPATYVSVHGVQTITFPSSPSLVLTDPNDPIDVAIGPDGSVYVANQGGTNSPAGGSVSVFAPGATTAMYTIPFGAATFVDGVVLDAQNNLYVTWRDASGNAYVNTSPAPVAPAERTVGTVTVETTNDVFHGVAFSERYGSIVYADSLAPAIVSVPQYRNDIPFDRLGVPDYIGFDKYKTHLYVADRRKNQVEVYNYPTGVIRALINGNHLGSTAGVAVLPAAIL